MSSQEIIFANYFSAAILLIIGLVLLYVASKRKRISRKIKAVKTAIKAIIWAIGITAVLSIINVLLPETLGNYKSDMDELADLSMPVFTFISTCLIAPLSEELIFRFAGIEIFEWLKKVIRKSFRLSESTSNFGIIIFTALLFALCHENAVQGLYAFVMGIYLGQMYSKNRNILQNIWFHIIYNTFNLVLAYLIQYLNGAL